MKKLIDGVVRGPYTNEELFNAVNAALKEKGLFPAALDYGLAETSQKQIRTTEWNVIGRVTFGCEGIYLDLWAEGDVYGEGKCERVKLGTYKTLFADRTAHKMMACLGSDFVFETEEFVQKNRKAFNWTGFSVDFYDDTTLRSGCTNVASLQAARLLAAKVMNDPAQAAVLSDVVITDNSNGMTYRLSEEV